MIVTTTEVQNNFGKYLKLTENEEIIITRNGKKVAKLVKYEKSNEYLIKEKAVDYNYNSQKMKVNYDEFKRITEDSENRYEYIDGYLYLMASPTVKHQRAVRNIFGKFISFFNDNICEPFTSPFDVTLYKDEEIEENINVVQPDILVICDQENIDEDDRYQGTPELVVEVLSKTTKNHDFITKLELYRLTGINEYWIVNPFTEEIYIFLLKDDEIKEIKSYKKHELLRSFTYEGLKIELNEIFY